METWRKTQESLPVVKPKFSADFLEAVVREGAEEMTLKRDEEGMLRTFVNTTNVKDSEWKPTLVNEDWHAVFQAIYKGVNGLEWETMYYKYEKLHEAVNLKKPGDNKEAKALLPLKRVQKKSGRLQRPEKHTPNREQSPSVTCIMGTTHAKINGCVGRSFEAYGR